MQTSTFDPKKAKESGNQGLPASEYLLAIRSFERRESKKGKDYLLAKLVVIAGAAKNKTFRDIISLDTSNEGTAFRLALLLESCGHEDAIDLNSDDELRQALLNKPFKAKVNRKVENGYTNNGIERYVVGEQVTDSERETMEQWAIEAAANAEYQGDADAPHAADGGDDDIPF